MLKKQKGKYKNVETPSMADWVAPHVFHGIKTEVTVAESSKVLLKLTFAKLFFLNALLNILPGTRIDKYWSDTVKLNNTHVPEVVNIRDDFDFANFDKKFVITFKNPEPSIDAPNIIAASISHTVFNIPDIPLDFNKLFTRELSDSKEISPDIELITDIKDEMK